MNDGGVWGPACTAALGALLANGLRLRRLHVSGVLWREADLIELLALITHDSPLTDLNLSNGMVGLGGLQAVLETARRCERLARIDLFNVGPRLEGKWESLGCFTGGAESEDCVLLLELHCLLRDRGGVVLNEAFMDDCNGGGALLASCGDP